MPQLQRPGVPFHRCQIAGLAAKGFAVGPGCGLSQEDRIIVGQVFLEDGGRHGRIVQLADGPGIHLGEGLRHKQAALLRQALDNGLRGGHVAAGVSRAEKLHVPSLLFSPAWCFMIRLRQMHFL